MVIWLQDAILIFQLSHDLISPKAVFSERPCPVVANTKKWMNKQGVTINGIITTVWVKYNTNCLGKVILFIFNFKFVQNKFCAV